jgi:hypothetical protein
VVRNGTKSASTFAGRFEVDAATMTPRTRCCNRSGAPRCPMSPPT